MFKIYDGRKSFYQWDVDRKLIVEDASINQVHFCNRTDDCSLVCEVYNEGSLRVVNVPNILLQDNWRINVFGYDSNYTKFSERFEVIARSRPGDYVYTETETIKYSSLLERIELVEQDIANVTSAEEIYVGSDVPTDENIKVWVDPSEQLEFATKEYVDDAIKNVDVDLSEYAKKSDIPDVSNFVVMSDITALGYQTAEQVTAAITTALGAIANAEEGAY